MFVFIRIGWELISQGTKQVIPTTPILVLHDFIPEPYNNLDSWSLLNTQLFLSKRKNTPAF